MRWQVRASLYWYQKEALKAIGKSELSTEIKKEKMRQKDQAGPELTSRGVNNLSDSLHYELIQ